LASKLLYYDGKDLSTINLRGQLRGLAWDRQDRFPIVVGNGGRVLRVQANSPIPLDSGTRHNLRAVSVNPRDGTALIVGNAGTVLLLEDERFTKITVPTFENLRTVAWNHDGSMALLAGNNGTLFKFSPGQVVPVDAGRANLRDVSWRPKSGSALISSNCFAEEFIPSPDLFNYEAETGIVRPLNEGRLDLIGVDWKPTGESALVVGYDVVWHTGFIGDFNGTTLSAIPFENKHVYPVAVSWKPSADIAAIVTATAQVGMAKGTVFLWNGKSLNSSFIAPDFFFSDVAWTWKGNGLAAIASTETKTFNA
jgi:WD40 repeat protein